jgi:cyclopropane-fatty-acyl-phospholipid synthase
MANLFKKKYEELFAFADVNINGNRSWDIQGFNEGLYRRVFFHTTLGLGEVYMYGWWEAENIDQFIYTVLNAHLDETVKYLPILCFNVKNKLLNLQKKSKAFRILMQSINKQKIQN